MHDDPENHPIAYWLPVGVCVALLVFTVCEPSVKLAWEQHEQRVAIQKFREERAAEKLQAQR